MNTLFTFIFLLFNSISFNTFAPIDLNPETVLSQKTETIKKEIFLPANNFEKEIKKTLKKKILPVLNPIKPKILFKKSIDAVKIKKFVKETNKNLKQKIVALTFDDGPAPATSEILKILAKREIPATFFTVGRQIEIHPNKLKEIQAYNQVIANHSFYHKKFLYMSKEEIKADFEKMSNLIFKITGNRPKFFRSPYGFANAFIIQNAALPLIQWSVDIRDWEGEKSKNYIYQILDKQLQTGGIILLHDLKKSSPKNLQKVLTYLEEKNYTIVPLQNIIDEYQKKFNEYPRIIGQAYQKYIIPAYLQKKIIPKNSQKKVISKKTIKSETSVSIDPQKADIKDILKYYKGRIRR